MTLGVYQVLVVNPDTGTTIDLIDGRRFKRLEYSRKVNDYGRLSLTFLASDRIRTLNGTIDTILQDQVNVIFDVYRDNGSGFELEDSYLMRYASQFQDENDIDWLIIGADQVLKFFADTIIVPDDDPAGANGYSTKSGIADLVMYDFVDNQVINPFTNADRQRSYISNDVSENLGQDVFARKQYETLLDVLRDLTVQGRVDFTLTRTTGANFLFKVQFVGRNLTYTDNYPFAPYLLFSPERRNLKRPSLTIDRYDEVTVTWISTQGIEEDRLVVPKSSPELYRPLNRRENIIDARELEDDANLSDALATAGAAELRTKQPQKIFSFEIDTNVTGSRYQQDWQLGDRVTARYLDYQEDLRIMEVRIIAEGSTEQITPRFEKLIDGGY